MSVAGIPSFLEERAVFMREYVLQRAPNQPLRRKTDFCTAILGATMGCMVQAHM